MRINSLVLTAAIALGTAASVQAQEHPHTGSAPHPDMPAMFCGGGMGGMMHGMSGHRMGSKEMMAGMMSVPSPAMLLRHKDDLDLNATQVTQLEALQKQAQPGCMQHMQMGMTEHRAADQMLQAAKPDLTAYAAKMKEAAAHMVEGNVAMLKAGIAARDILTPAQRAKCEEMMKKKHH